MCWQLTSHFGLHRSDTGNINEEATNENIWDEPSTFLRGSWDMFSVVDIRLDRIWFLAPNFSIKVGLDCWLR